MVWQFGELGYDISIDENGRTGKKPVKWEYYDNAERKKLHNTYTKLMELRNDYPELFTPSAQLDWKVTTSFWANGRFLTLKGPDNKHLVVVGNFTNNDGTYSTTFPTTGKWYNYMNTTETLQVNTATMNVTVPANDFKIYTSFSTASMP